MEDQNSPMVEAVVLHKDDCHNVSLDNFARKMVVVAVVVAGGTHDVERLVVPCHEARCKGRMHEKGKVEDNHAYDLDNHLVVGVDEMDNHVIFPHQFENEDVESDLGGRNLGGHVVGVSEAPFW